MAIEERVIRHVRCDLCGLLGPASEDSEERADSLAADAGFVCEWLRDWCGDCVQAGHRKAEWWDSLNRRLDQCSVYGPDSLKVSANLYDGQPLPAPGRALPGWETEALEAAASSLQDHELVVVEPLVDAATMLQTEPTTEHGNPVLGGISINYYGHEVLLVVRIDSVAEIFTRISHQSWPTHLLGE